MYLCVLLQKNIYVFTYLLQAVSVKTVWRASGWRLLIMVNSLRGKLGAGWTEAELKILISNARRAAREERFGRDIYDKMAQRKITKGDILAASGKKSHIGEYWTAKGKIIGFAEYKTGCFVAYSRENNKIVTCLKRKGIVNYLQARPAYKMIWKPLGVNKW